MPTLKEISEKSGYSVTTISRVLNGDPSIRVKDATRQAILDAAEDLQYKSGRLPRFSVVQEMTWHIVNNFPKKEELSDPYYLAIRHGIENSLDRLGARYHYSYSDSPHTINWQQDLAILVGYSSYSQVRELPLDFHRAVVVDSVIPQFDSVASKLEEAVLLIFEHLYSLGHRDIVFLGARDEQEIMDKREQAFIRLATERKIYHSETSVLAAHQFSIESAYGSLKDYLKKLRKWPTAIMAASDSLAIGAIHALHELGAKIPGDISVTGINGIPMSQFTRPTLTTVKLFAEAMGEYAVSMMLEKSASKREIPLEILFPCSLVLRESSAVPGKN